MTRVSLRVSLLLALTGCGAEYNLFARDDAPVDDTDADEPLPVDSDGDTDGGGTDPVEDTALPYPVSCDDTDDVTEPGVYRDVTTGEGFSCAITGEGRLRCWGADNCGQVSEVPDGDEWLRISAGGCHACAIDCNGQVACWGLYLSEPANDLIPSSRYLTIDAGQQHACGIKVNGRGGCWGYDNGDGYLQLPDPGAELSEIRAGHFTSCAVDPSGELACWGDPATTGQWGPLVGPLSEMDTRASRVCALDASRRLVCEGPTNDAAIRQATQSSGTQVRDFAIGGHHVCVVTAVGAIGCYGDDTYGQLSVPQRTGFVRVDAGGQHTCALHEDGSVTCWGRADSGQTVVPPP